MRKPNNTRRRLVVNADDFGQSPSINDAVIEAHRRGILTTASLMVAGDSFEAAVELARAHPRLGVGLHLTLCRGRSVSPAQKIPSLVDERQEFGTSPVAVGIKYFFSRRARSELEEEIAAQFAKFRETGLRLDHVNGHLHFHLHPSVFARVCSHRPKAVRMTYDPLYLDFALGQGRFIYRLSHAFIFAFLSASLRPRLRAANIAYCEQVFGLLENDRVTEDYILKLLRMLPPGDSELYSHPARGSLSTHRAAEFEALVSPKVRGSVQREKIELVRYEDLWLSS